MSAKYFAVLTNIGAARLANATALGSQLDITHMAVGDGGGTLPTPNPAQTTLVNEKRRAAINTMSIDANNANQIIAEQVIPESEGGFWIREIGLFDAEGNLLAVANCAESYKPQLQEGSGRTQTVRMILIVSSTESVTLKIDPAVVLATRGYVESALTEHEKSRKHPDGNLTAKGFVQLSNATDSNSETLAATPKAVKAVNDNANGRVPSGRKVNGKALSADVTLSAGDVDAYSKTETDTKVSAAITAANDAATAAANANANANGRVPSGRTVNGKALSADITLSAGDIGAYTKAETDARVATATTAANNAATAAANANTNADGRVPSDRTVNGKPLSTNIALSANDIGAYTKAETDEKVSAATTAANNANTNANGRVPVTRTINGKALTGDITLTATDLGRIAWVSDEYPLVLNTPIIVNHGLNIDPLHTRCDVLFKCITENNGYAVGDYGIGFGSAAVINSVTRTAPPTPALTAATIQYNIGKSGISGFEKNSGEVVLLSTAALIANWRVIFRVFN